VGAYKTMGDHRLRLLRTIQILFIASLVLLTVVIVVLQVTRSRHKFNQQAETMRVDYVKQQKVMIKLEVERLVKRINYQRSRAEQLTREIVRQRVYEACDIALNIYQQNKTRRTAIEIKAMIVDALRPIRFNQKSGYFFIFSRNDGMNILFADKPELEGMFLLNFQDTQGQYIVRDMIAITEESGEGFYEYLWTKPGTEGNNHKKIAFTKQFEPYDWFIGTGLYVDDVEIHNKTELLKQITDTHFGENGYFFVSDWQGISLAHGAQPSLVGTDMWEAEDSKGNKTSQSLISMAKKETGGFVEYWWRKPDTKKERPKIAYAKGVPEWGWMIGTGVYLDDIETVITALQGELQQELRKDITNMALAAGITLILFLAILQIINRRLSGDFSLLVTFFEQAVAGDEEIDRSQVHFDELYQMAGNANSLLCDKIATKKDLQNERQRFKDLAEQLPVGIFEADLDLNLTYVNQKGLELFGYCADDLANGLNALEVIVPEDRALLRKNIAKRLVAEDNEINEYRALKKDGSTFPTISHSSLIQRDGENVGIRGFIIDITERKQAEEEQLKLKKLESVGVLAGGIAHDFNNLLTGLFGNMEMAKRFLSEDHKSYKFLETAGQSLENATNLTLQLLTFAKGGDPIKETLSIAAILTETAQFSLRGSNAKLQTDIAPDLCSVNADKGQISQVISNLVINAQQAMPEGGDITIRAKNGNISTGRIVEISIEDEGTGIAPHYLAKIFDPYFTTKQQGSGLGLASCYSIINKHKGNITVASTLNKGTKFTIHFPAVAAKTAPTEKREIIAADLVDTSKFVRVLIMDDEEAILTICGAMIEEMGHQIACAVNGENALEKYRDAVQNQSPYDIVICDLTIPGGMGGQEVAQEILKVNPRAKLIVSSGYSTDPVMANYRKYGFQGRISKPYLFVELQKTIEQVLKA
jgi:two-component system cell cycle sensor histidine kinase/response regulator CckA